MNHRSDSPTPQELADLFANDPHRVAATVEAALGDSSGELALPGLLERTGLPAEQVVQLITPYLRGGGRDLGHPGFLAHMDPPTPWITWVVSLLAASSNQNLLHTDTGPAARLLEETVISWLAPVFGMDGGHLVPGSTVANLTALWAARDLTGANTVVASTNSHLSIRKAAAILGLQYVAIDPGTDSALTIEQVHQQSKSLDPGSTIVVLTAGTTGVGAIDQLDGTWPAGRPAWLHVDGAWAAPLKFSAREAHRVSGIELADSLSVSAHKWLFQPKESALILFRDAASASQAISIDGTYLQVPNIGLLGSHGAAAAPLAATMLQIGLDGIERLIDHGMMLADQLVELVRQDQRLELYGPNVSGVVAWRHVDHNAAEIKAELKDAFVSSVEIDGRSWLRSVAVNPMADPQRVVAAVLAAADRLEAG